MAVACGNGWTQLSSYRSQSVVGLAPAELLLKTYDLILSALRARDEERACRGLAQLIDSLDFRYHDVATGLLRLYHYCMEEIKRGNSEAAVVVLRDLRDTWADALGWSSKAAS